MTHLETQRPTEEPILFFDALMQDPEATDAMKIEWLYVTCQDYWQRILLAEEENRKLSQTNEAYRRDNGEMLALLAVAARPEPPNDYILLERIQTLEAQIRQQAETLRLAQLDIAQRVEYSQQEARARLALLHTARRLEEQLQESNAEVQRLQSILAAVNAGLTAQQAHRDATRSLVEFWAEGE